MRWIIFLQALNSTAVGRDSEDILVLLPRDGGDTWTCKIWVMEIIHRILIPHGWAHRDIIDVASLLPKLRQAARETEARMIEDGKPVIVSYA